MKLESNLFDVITKVKSDLDDQKSIIKNAYLEKIKEKLPNIDMKFVDIVFEKDNDNGYSTVFKGLTQEQIKIILAE